MYPRMLWVGLSLIAAGCAAAILSYAWDVPYGGPMTGLGPALLLLAALAVAALGALLALLAVILGLIAGARQGKSASTDEA